MEEEKVNGVTTTVTTPNKTEVLEMTEIFGDFGRWQILMGFMIYMSAFFGCWNVLGQVLYTYPMNHWCARPPEFSNLTVAQWQNLTIPIVSEDGHTAFSKCRMFDIRNVSNASVLLELEEEGKWKPRETVHCSSWEFDKSFYKANIVEKWDLTCNNSWLASMSQSVYMTGFLVAVLFFGQLGDKVGRRPVIILCVVLQLLAGFATAFSTSFVFYTIVRFFLAMGTHGLYTTGFVVLMELVGAKYRPKLNIMLGLGWASGFITLPGLGWLIRYWNTQQLVVAICSLTLIIVIWILPESPRWLITQGKYKEAKEIMEKAAKMNGKLNENTPLLIDEFCLKVENEKKLKIVEERRPTVFDLLRTPNMRKKTLNMFFAWFVTSFVYYGLSLNTHSLGGNALVNLAIAGSVEIPCQFIAFLVIRYLGRCKPLSFSLLFAALSCLLTIPIGEDLLWLRITLAMLGKCGVSIAFGIVYIYSAEIFPTVVRNVGVGSSSTCARIGAIIAPFVKELGNATNRSVPLAVFGSVTAVSGLLVLLLPETMNKIIPDSLEQAEAFGIKKKKSEEAQDGIEMKKRSE